MLCAWIAVVEKNYRIVREYVQVAEYIFAKAKFSITFRKAHSRASNETSRLRFNILSTVAGTASESLIDTFGWKR